MKLNRIFEQVLEESLKKQIEDFNIKVNDENSLKSAYDYLVKIIGIMASLFVVLNDIIGYKQLFESENESQDDLEFRATIENIKLCGLKVERVTGMIYEYICKGTVSNAQGIEKTFIPEHTANIVNNNTHQAQTAVRDYNGQQSIENSCQVYDLTVDIFNSSINAVNMYRNKNVPEAEQSNLVTIFREKH